MKCSNEKPFAFAKGFYCCSHELSLNETTCTEGNLGFGHGLECCQSGEREACEGGERVCNPYSKYINKTKQTIFKNTGLL